MKKANFPSKRNQGFSLVELLVVMAIIAILMGLVTGIAGVVNRTSLESQAKAQIADLQLELERYREDNGIYPLSYSFNPQNPTLGELFFLWYETRYPGTRYTTTDVGSTTDTSTGNALRYTRDPWGQPYIYVYDSANPNVYLLGSKGSDARHGSTPDSDTLQSFGRGDDITTRNGAL